MDGNEIREIIKKKRLYQWEIAEELHINEFTLSRWLRGSLTREREQRILEAIQRVLERG